MPLRSLTLDPVNLLLWMKIPYLTLFKIITVIRTGSGLRLFFMGGSGFAADGRGDWGELSPLMTKILSFILLLDVTPHQIIESSTLPSCPTPSLPWLYTTYSKKVSLIAFRQTLRKILHVLHIFSFTTTIY